MYLVFLFALTKSNLRSTVDINMYMVIQLDCFDLIWLCFYLLMML